MQRRRERVNVTLNTRLNEEGAMVETGRSEAKEDGVYWNCGECVCAAVVSTVASQQEGCGFKLRPGDVPVSAFSLCVCRGSLASSRSPKPTCV